MLSEHDQKVLNQVLPGHRKVIAKQSTLAVVYQSKPSVAELHIEAFKKLMSASSEEAISILKNRALQLDPIDPHTYLNLAIASYGHDGSGTFLDQACSLTGCPSQAFLMRYYLLNNLQDLQRAAEMGLEEAKKVLIRETNPYAKLCSQVVNQLMRQHFYSHSYSE